MTGTGPWRLPARSPRLRSSPPCSASTLSACGINNVPTLEERAKSAWSEVQNQYQRRADLIPNLVETVKGFAQQEREVLTQVTEARAGRPQVQVDASTITDPQKFKRVPGSAEPAVGRARPPARHRRALSGAEVERQFPRPAIPARGHREPHRRGAPRLHRDRARLQHRAAHDPRPLDRRVPLSRRQADGDIRRHGRLGPSAGGEILEIGHGCPLLHRRGDGPLSSRAWRVHGRSVPGRSLSRPPRPVPASRPGADLSRPHRPGGRRREPAEPDERAALEAKLKAHEDKTSDQVVVATVPLLEGYEVEDYANRLFRPMEARQADKNNGVLLLVAPNERKVRIEVGYGLEGALTDALSKVIIATAIAPQFKQGDFAGGIEGGSRCDPDASSPATRRNGSGAPRCARTSDRAEARSSFDRPFSSCVLIVCRADAAVRRARSAPIAGAGGGWVVMPLGGFGRSEAAAGGFRRSAGFRAVAARPAAAARRGAGDDLGGGPGGDWPSRSARRRARTAGEIVVVIAQQASGYRSVPVLWALLAALVVPWPLIWLTTLSACTDLPRCSSLVGDRLSCRAVAAEAPLSGSCRASSSAPAPMRSATGIPGARPHPNPRPHGRPGLRRHGGALCGDRRRYRHRRPGRPGRSGATTIADLLEAIRAGSTGRRPGRRRAPRRRHARPMRAAARRRHRRTAEQGDPDLNKARGRWSGVQRPGLLAAPTITPGLPRRAPAAAPRSRPPARGAAQGDVDSAAGRRCHSPMRIMPRTTLA